MMCYRSWESSVAKLPLKIKNAVKVMMIIENIFLIAFIHKK